MKRRSLCLPLPHGEGGSEGLGSVYLPYAPILGPSAPLPKTPFTLPRTLRELCKLCVNRIPSLPQRETMTPARADRSVSPARRRDDDDGAGKLHPRELVDGGLAGAGRHDGEGVESLYERLDRGFLAGAQAVGS